MSLKLILRLIWAIVFGSIAVIYSELLPPLQGTNPLVAKIFVTSIASLVGFIIFPDVASKVTLMTLSLFNVVIHRLSSEILNQLLRLPRGNFQPFASQVPQVGGMSLQKPLILDTSAIIDGRILDIVKTGFLSGLVLVPNFVLIEMQQVADSADSIKRARGRRAFEILDQVKRSSGIKVEIWDKEVAGKNADEKLLKLTKSLHGKIVTTDFNLNRVATAHGVTVLNVNDLSNALKTVAIPGESFELKVVHVGKNPKQGVGYLPDGTMIVVEDGAELIGKTVKVEVSRNLQGPAGRMFFAHRA